MRILLLTFVLTAASTVLADVTYNVIGIPDVHTNTFAVEVNKKLYPLSTSKASSPLWSAKVPGVSASSSYRYVQLNRKKEPVQKEKFTRKLANNDATPNEFFNRQTTFTTFSPIKQVYGPHVRPETAGVFDKSQIATILITADPDEFTDMLNNPMAEDPKSIKAGFKFINADNVYSADEVKIKVSGHGSRKYRKTSLRVKFGDNTGTFFGRSAIKLRAEYEDPTVFRERLYLDLLNSVGVAASQGSFARVYVNGKPHGFFFMMEAINGPMLMHTIHRDTLKDEKALGSLFQMGSGLTAGFAYKGPVAASYDPQLYTNRIQGNNPKDEPMQQLIAFMKDLKDWDSTDPNGVAFWSERLDLDGWLRSMALEYLTGSWDSFWWRGNNYFIYYNPQRELWQFIPSDFDHTFSTGGHPNVDTTYKKYGRNTAAGNHKQPMITKLIYQNKAINKKFEDILHTISNDLVNEKVLDERINAYETQIGQEVAWDHSIDRSALPGVDLGWTIEDFHQSIRGPVKTIPAEKSVPVGIKPWINSRSKSVARQIKK
ncbi:hypothetical protein BGZ83_007856 [Gryganskiella cystojenkinii]|nr:hypothetical protein BGZ83_007856 [Gryganskiella cystojenkinii]